MTDPKESQDRLAADDHVAETLTSDAKTPVVPRVVGEHPRASRSLPRMAAMGRISRGVRRPLARGRGTDFLIDLTGALGVLAHQAAGPPRGRGTVEELGEDPYEAKRRRAHRSLPVSTSPTASQRDASSRRHPETISLDRACELLAERRTPNRRVVPAKRSRRQRRSPRRRRPRITCEKGDRNRQAGGGSPGRRVQRRLDRGDAHGRMMRRGSFVVFEGIDASGRAPKPDASRNCATRTSPSSRATRPWRRSPALVLDAATHDADH